MRTPSARLLVRATLLLLEPFGEGNRPPTFSVRMAEILTGRNKWVRIQQEAAAFELERRHGSVAQSFWEGSKFTLGQPARLACHSRQRAGPRPGGEARQITGDRVELAYVGQGYAREPPRARRPRTAFNWKWSSAQRPHFVCLMLGRIFKMLG
jgi:hypothetical protein